MKRIFDPEIEAAAKNVPSFDLSDVESTRALVEEFFEQMAAQGFERPTDDRIEEIERTIPGPEGAPDVPIRIYMPRDRRHAGPGFVNFHGGGFVLGDLETEHPRGLAMAAKGGAARDQGGPAVAFQMLIYPAVDDRCETASMKAGTDLYVWTYQNTLDCWDHYIGEDRTDVSPYAAPARAEDLSGLPPAYVMTCEHDPLRDEGILYAMRMMEAGVPVELHHYPGTVHGFDLLTPSDVSTRALSESVEAFCRAVEA